MADRELWPIHIWKVRTRSFIPNIKQDAEGMQSVPAILMAGGIPSHASPDTPGSINEGGELGYSLLHAYGAAFDNPDLLVCCVVGDGEAETGPCATSWHSNKFLNPARDGAVLPVLHLNGYKIAGPTVLARIPKEELIDLFVGYGYKAAFCEGDDPPLMHQLMAATLDKVIAEIKKHSERSQENPDARRPQWPMIICAARKAGLGRRLSTGCKSVKAIALDPCSTTPAARQTLATPAFDCGMPYQSQGMLQVLSFPDRSRNLVRAERPFDLQPVDNLRPSPAFRAAQNNHRPLRAPRIRIFLGFALNALDLGNHFVQRRRHQLVHQWRIIAFHKMRLIAVSDEQIDKFFFRDARQHGRPRDFVNRSDAAPAVLRRRAPGSETCWSASSWRRSGFGFRHRPPRSRPADQDYQKPLRRHGAVNIPARRLR